MPYLEVGATFEERVEDSDPKVGIAMQKVNELRDLLNH